MSVPAFKRWGALAMIAGGAMWALFPFGTPLVENTESGTSTGAAGVAYFSLMAVVPLLLLLVGLIGLRTGIPGASGRLGRVGVPLLILALALMLVGNAIEIASIAFQDSESGVGHGAFLIGFLLLLVGSVLIGIATWRTCRHRLARSGSVLLMGALPFGIALAIVLGTLLPDSDLGFWAAIATPFGAAWVLLGRAFTAQEIEEAASLPAHPA